MRSARAVVILLTAGMLLSVGVLSASADDIEGAVLVVDDVDTYAFVGWHGSYEFPSTLSQPWTIFLDVVSWATGGGIPADTEILLFTADGTNDPDNTGNLDAGTFYNRLVAEGYDPDVADQVDIGTMTDFSAYDLVIYPNLDDRSAANVVNDGVAFITMEPGQTDEMNIGTGVSVFDDWAQTFTVVDNTHVTTDTLGAGLLFFDNAVRTEAIDAAGNGHVLITVAVPEPGTLMLLAGGFSGLACLRRRRTA